MIRTKIYHCKLSRIKFPPRNTRTRSLQPIPRKLAKPIFYFASKLHHSSINNEAMNVDISDMRKSYEQNSFMEDSLVAKEPITQFKNWFDLACGIPEIEEPNAVCLATAAKNGRPSCRMVLLKGFTKEGFKFYTNYDSRKGNELAENPFAALTFYWPPVHRCVRIEGKVEKLSEEESKHYFNSSRPRESQLAACASNQSSPLAGKEELEKKFSDLAKEYEDVTVEIPKPKNWGGFLLVPDMVEFWQGQKNRMHDRIRFRKLSSSEVIDNKLIHAGDDGWVYERLSP